MLRTCYQISRVKVLFFLPFLFKNGDDIYRLEGKALSLERLRLWWSNTLDANKVRERKPSDRKIKVDKILFRRSQEAIR